jgi:AcrR family transcriptional regulator
MTRQTLRDRMRNAVREELRETAFAMFLESSFDAVSIEQISARAGVSQRTFFRYFANKEDVLLEWFDHYAPVIYDTIRSAPANAAPFDVARQAMVRAASLADDSPEERRRNLLVSELVMTSPRLRAGLAERRHIWEAEIGRLFAERMNTSLDHDIRPALLASAAVSCAVATLAWNIGKRRSDGSGSATTTDEAFAALKEIVAGGSGIS